MILKASVIRQYLEQRQISVRALAARMGMHHHGHLLRVLRGEREGSREFLKSVVNAAESMQGPRQERPDDVERLIDAATHVFFLKRGDFESAICADAGRRKGKEGKGDC
jgi:transcriptional regulator with XRE-family HTH domain